MVYQYKIDIYFLLEDSQLYLFYLFITVSVILVEYQGRWMTVRWATLAGPATPRAWQRY